MGAHFHHPALSASVTVADILMGCLMLFLFLLVILFF